MKDAFVEIMKEILVETGLGVGKEALSRLKDSMLN